MIVRFLKWALSKFEPAQEEVVFSKAELKAWPFPAEEPKPKKKPTVKKATTRTVKKPAVVAKTVRTKKAK